MNPALTSFFSEPVVVRLGWTLIHSFWQGGIIAIILRCALRPLRTSGTRHTACVVALGAVLACSIGTFLLEAGGNHPPSFVESHPTGPITAGAAPSHYEAFRAPVPPSSDSQGRWKLVVERVLPWLVVVWMLGVALVSFRRLSAWLWLRHWSITHSYAAAAELQQLVDRLCQEMVVRRAVHVVECARIVTPMLIGFFKPVILLPATVITGLEPAQLEAVLAHELAHLSRGDAIILWLQNFAETVFFYHPAVAWISHRLRIEREHCCDDLAVARGADRHALASALGQIALWNSSPFFSESFAVTGHMPVLGRMRRLLAPPVPPPASSSWFSALLTSGAIICLLLLFITPIGPVSAEPAPETPSLPCKATAKIVMAARVDPGTPYDDAEARRAEFHATQVEILKSGELHRRTLQRLHALHLEFRDHDVVTSTAVTKGSSIMVITLSADDADYSTVYLNGLLDEYLAFRREMLEKSVGNAMNKVIEEVLVREKDVKRKAEELAVFQRAHPQDFDSESNKPRYSALTSDLHQAEDGFKSWKKALERLEASLVKTTAQETVAIMERPAKPEKAK